MKEVVPLTQLSRDLAAGRLPSFGWITPDLCHDVHERSVARGDAFLSRLIPTLPPALGKEGVVCHTCDERSDAPEGCCGDAHGRTHRDRGCGSGGPRGRQPVHAEQPLLHPEDDRGLLGLPELGPAACSCTRPMTDLLRVPCPAFEERCSAPDASVRPSG